MSISLKQVFSCIICKEQALGAARKPVVPKCRSAVVTCKLCRETWLVNSHTCPNCRVPIENLEQSTMPLPELRLLTSILQSEQ